MRSSRICRKAVGGDGVRCNPENYNLRVKRQPKFWLLFCCIKWIEIVKNIDYIEVFKVKHEKTFKQSDFVVYYKKREVIA